MQVIRLEQVGFAEVAGEGTSLGKCVYGASRSSLSCRYLNALVLRGMLSREGKDGSDTKGSGKVGPAVSTSRSFADFRRPDKNVQRFFVVTHNVHGCPSRSMIQRCRLARQLSHGLQYRQSLAYLPQDHSGASLTEPCETGIRELTSARGQVGLDCLSRLLKAQPASISRVELSARGMLKDQSSKWSAQ
jgi:hypothetical protein